MSNPDSANREGLQFFGRVSASVSHEIKNVLAIVNEAAGLIEDFTLMAERGMPIEPERLKSAAKTIQGQIRRGDTIVRNMNAFSHLTDESVRVVDLVETLELTVALATRLADMKQVRLSLGDCEAVSLKANPFDLTQLLHSSIVAALDGMPSGDTLTIGVKPEKDGASFSLSTPGKDAPQLKETSFASLAQTMGVSVTADESTRTCMLLLPSA